MSSPDPVPVTRRTTVNDDGLIVHRDVLWSYAHIALFSGFSYDYVANELVFQPRFPKPTRPGGKKGHPRYVAGEVMDYLKSFRD